MKSLISVVALLLILATSASASTIAFKKSVNHMLAPVSVSDVLTIKDDETLKTLMWPENLKGWVSQSQVDNWLLSINMRVANGKWQGIKRVWIDWCYKPDSTKFNRFVEDKLNNVIAEEGLKLHNLLPLEESALPCFDHAVAQFTWLNEHNLKANTVEVDVEFKLADGSLVVERISLGYSAKVDALAVSDKSPRHSKLDTLKLVSREVIWTGKEITKVTELKGLRLTKTLAANALLQVDHLQPLPDISAGQQVKVKVENGPITLETKATAMTAGNIGQNIKIKVEGSRVVNEAKVIAKGVVNVSV